MLQKQITSLEQALKRRENQLTELQRQARLGYWEWAPHSRQFTWSTELFALHGLPPQPTIDWGDWISLIPESDVQIIETIFSQAVQDQHPFTFQYHVTRPNGIVYIIHSWGQVRLNSAGEVVALHGTAQDITTQKNIELQLSQTVKRLQTLHELGQMLVTSRDMSAIYEQALASLRELLNAEGVFVFLQADNELEIVACDVVEGVDAKRFTGQKLPLDAGVVGEVWQTGRSLLLTGDDCTQHISRHLTTATNYYPQTLLTTPIRWQTKQIGILQAAHRIANAFTTHDIALIELFATWLAIAAGLNQEYTQLSRQLHERDALARIAKAFSETRDHDQILNLIVLAASDVISHVDWTVIHLLDHDNTLRPVAYVGVNIDPQDYTIRTGEGIAGRVLATGDVINVSDLQTDARHLPIDRQQNVRSLLVAPVQTRKEIIGTISVQCAIPSTFSPSDEKLIKMLGIYAGLAIENARLFADQQRATAYAEMRRQRLHQLTKQVVTAQEKERERIARELHDDSGQALTALKISLSILRRQLADADESTQQRLDEAIDLTSQTLNRIRHIAHGLLPPALSRFGLNMALEQLCQDFAEHANLPLNYDGQDIPPFSFTSAVCLYRLAQEALTNTAKYAEATTISVSLSADDENVTLIITDDGKGFQLADLATDVNHWNGMGILGMYERLEILSGALQINTAPGKGTTIIACLPLTHASSPTH